MKVIRLWRFPAQDFDQWVRDCCKGEQAVTDFDGYLEWLSRITSEAIASGHEVEFVEWTVTSMVATLKDFGMKNTSANRAKLLVGPRAFKRRTLGLALRHDPRANQGQIGWALVEEGRESKSGEIHFGKDLPMMAAIKTLLRMDGL